jgi:hypothetical protein
MTNKHARAAAVILGFLLTLTATVVQAPAHAETASPSRAVAACQAIETDTHGGRHLARGTYHTAGLRAPLLAKTMRRERRAASDYASHGGQRRLRAHVTMRRQWAVLSRLCYVRHVDINYAEYSM